jgi:hypothetical protein
MAVWQREKMRRLSADEKLKARLPSFKNWLPFRA